MGWPHCFRTSSQSQSQSQAQAQAQASSGQTSASTSQSQSQHQQSASPSKRPPPNERDKRAAEALKAEGNSYYAMAKYGAAIEKYTEALTLWPGLTVLLVNRALCHKKREAWDAARQDSEAALCNDSQLMKAHYVLGIALRHLDELPQSVQHLKQALELARQKNDSIKDEIWHELAQVQYKRWEHDSAAQLGKQDALQQRIQQALQRQHQQELAESPSQAAEQRQHAEAAQLEEMFRAGRRALKAGEPASAFTCPLTMEVFRDPIMTPSGLSYERSALLEHLRKVGTFDPITREAVTASQLVPNIALRSATLQYLEEHPWAWAECC